MEGRPGPDESGVGDELDRVDAEAEDSELWPGERGLDEPATETDVNGGFHQVAEPS